ncbi:MAG: ribose-phosphate diphosphokinase [Haloferacaceae archaeon]
MIVPGSTSQSLAAALADARGAPLAAVSYDRHPDGELLAAVPGFDAARATVVAATTTAEAHVELLQLQDAVREAGATDVTTVLPYMGYGRQDEAFEPGHPVSARAVARAVSTGADRVVVVTPHEDAVADFFDVPCTVVDAAPRLAAPLPADLDDPLFLAPDAGATDLAATVRDAYGRGDTDHFEKTRQSGTEVTVEPSDARVAGRDVVIADDIVATGSTMSEAVAALAARGVGRVFVACVHPVLARDARTKLARAGVAAIHATDTVERPVSTVSAAPVLASALD